MNSLKRRFHENRHLISALILGLLLRIILDISLTRSGYYYGEDSDTFYRLGLCWRWALEPFFYIGHWVPFQFWLNGLIFRLLTPIMPFSTIFIPISVNHFFFLGSLIVTFRFANHLQGKLAGYFSIILAVTLTQDIWTTYSALSEPIIIFFGLLIGLAIYEIEEGICKNECRNLLVIGFAALIASATHFIGWFFALFGTLYLFFYAVRNRRRLLDSRNKFIWFFAAFGLTAAFPAIWMAVNLIKFSDPFFFLSKASSYHTYFAVESNLSRFSSTFQAFLQYEPLIFVAAIVSVPFIGWKNKNSMWYISTGIAYLVLLVLSGMNSWGIPDLHGRYILFPAWASIPFIAATFTRLVYPWRWDKLHIYALVGVLPIVGIIRSFSFTNWATTETIEAAKYISQRSAKQNTNPRVLIEAEWEYYQVAALGNLLRRPDSVIYIESDELQNSVNANTELNISSFDTIILTNPITIRALASDLTYVTAIGDYLVVEPGNGIDLSTESEGKIGDWENIQSNQFAVHMPSQTDVYGFPEEPLKVGQEAGIVKFLEMPKNGCVVLRASIRDYYNNDEYPWVFLQQLVVNDLVLWSHDVSGDEYFGWQDISYFIIPTTEEVKVKIRITNLQPVIEGMDFQRASRIGIRNLTVEECQ